MQLSGQIPRIVIIPELEIVQYLYQSSQALALHTRGLELLRLTDTILLLLDAHCLVRDSLFVCERRCGTDLKS